MKSYRFYFDLRAKAYGKKGFDLFLARGLDTLKTYDYTTILGGVWLRVDFSLRTKRHVSLDKLINSVVILLKKAKVIKYKSQIKRVTASKKIRQPLDVFIIEIVEIEPLIERLSDEQKSKIII